MWILWRTIVVWLTVVRKREKEIQKESGTGCDTIISPSKSLWCICKESQFTYSWICWLVLACTLAGFAFVTLLSSSCSLLVYSLSLSLLCIFGIDLSYTHTHTPPIPPPPTFCPLLLLILQVTEAAAVIRLCISSTSPQ